MSALEVTLVTAALLAGATGTWSPCGLSMIETIGPAGHRGGRTTTLAACSTFTVGALTGAIATFGSLAALGALVHGAGGAPAYALAAGIALGAAALEARGVPIVPQVRRQVPEHWRRLMPMPVASGLYGVLLGLGFTTFVLSFGVFALAGICFAVGEPATGALVGVGFGAGRALPVALLAPVADRPSGIRVTGLMAGRPQILRGFRLGDALALSACAAALILTAAAGASRLERRAAADPALAGSAIVYQLPDRSGVLERAGERVPLPGRDPAIGGGRVAVIRGDEIVVLSARDLGEVGRIPAPRADAVAISGTWIAWRARTGSRDVLRARHLADATRPGRQRTLDTARGSAQLGRPGLDANRLVYARASGAANLIVRRILGARGKTTLLRSLSAGLSNPSIRGDRLLYVRSSARGDQLRLARLGGPGAGRVLLSGAPSSMWSTALGAERAYVTRIRGDAPRAKVVSVNR